MSTTEAPAAAPQQIVLSLDALVKRANRIKEIDSQITAAGGNEAQARKAIVDELLTANKDQVEGIYTQVISQFQQLSGEVLVGLVSKLEEAMKGDLKTMTDTVVDEKVKALADSGSKVDVAALKETRKVEVDLFRSINQILSSLGVDTSAVEEPKRSGGGRPAGSGGGSGTKNGRNKENYRYTMDGKNRPPSQNSFSSLAYYATDGLFMAGTDLATLEKKDGERLGAPQLKAFLESKGVKNGEPDTYEIELPNGKKVGAHRVTVEDMKELGGYDKELIEAGEMEAPAPEAPAEPAAPEAPAAEAPAATEPPQV